ncbi:MAG: hypothetical protein D9V44_08350 [Actinobacteria bacterium]|nr:MAG: hypothetical protein D9V44_08350 [Actinomycetota bacterium]
MDETNLPENGSTPETPVPEQPIAPPEPMTSPIPNPVPKPKTDIGFLMLGLVTPIIAYTVTGMVSGLLATVIGDAFAAYFSILGLFQVVLFVVFPVMFFVGKSKGNVRMWSFGKGGLFFYLASLIIGLLAFGTCAVTGVLGG